MEKERMVNMELYLTTATERQFGDGETIPAGTKGRVIDIMVENDENRVLFFVEFENIAEWYSSDEIESCDHAQ